MLLLLLLLLLDLLVLLVLLPVLLLLLLVLLLKCLISQVLVLSVNLLLLLTFDQRTRQRLWRWWRPTYAPPPFRGPDHCHQLQLRLPMSGDRRSDRGSVRAAFRAIDTHDHR